MMRFQWIAMVGLLALVADLAWCQTFGHDSQLAATLRDGPPVEAVVDDVDVLRHSPEVKEEIENRIRRLEDRHGFRLRLLLRPVWMSGSEKELAATLQESWFPNGDGLVMIVETDNRKLGLGEIMGGRPTEETWLMPTHVSAMIRQRVSDRVNYNAPIEEFLRGLVFDMVDEHERYFQQKKEPPPKERVVKEVLFLLGGALCVGLGAGIVAWRVRRTHAREVRTVLRFPRVVVPERLGAPYGGGEIAVRRFGAGESAAVAAGVPGDGAFRARGSLVTERGAALGDGERNDAFQSVP
jgi:hypothetical protein